MEQHLTGKTYDIQNFSVQDGPGIRTTVFLKGCPLRCPWCHSPESQEFHTELNIMLVRCIGLEACGKCLSVCPKNAITEGPLTENPLGEALRYPDIDGTLCDNCGACATVCKPSALYLCGTDRSVDEILAKLERERPFFEESGGGVTVSGGECLCQPEFVEELLRRCKEAGFHTAVDTTGFVPWDALARVLPYTDVFLYDLKNMDSDLHQQVIGVPNALILENARKLAENDGRLWVRIPVIPMFNDSMAHFEKYGAFLSSIKDAVDIVQLLPYHNMGISKHDRLLKNDAVFTVEPPSDVLMQARFEQLERLGLKVRLH